MRRSRRLYLVSAQTSHVAGENSIPAQRYRQVVDRLREFRLEAPSCRHNRTITTSGRHMGHSSAKKVAIDRRIDFASSNGCPTPSADSDTSGRSPPPLGTGRKRNRLGAEATAGDNANEVDVSGLS